MALPTNVSLVTVHGTVLQAVDGSPADGAIIFSIPLVLRDYPALMMLVPDSITATLDTNGEFSVVLPATDDPDVDPTGWTYLVTEDWPGGRSDLRVALPATTDTVEWINVVPVSGGSEDYVPLTSMFDVLVAALRAGDNITLTVDSTLQTITISGEAAAPEPDEAYPSVDNFPSVDLYPAP